MSANNPLVNAPPRLSDLRGDDLRRELAARHRQHKANWQQTRTPGRLVSFLERILR
jgi:hypothetical protein